MNIKNPQQLSMCKYERSEKMEKLENVAVMHEKILKNKKGEESGRRSEECK